MRISYNDIPVLLMIICQQLSFIMVWCQFYQFRARYPMGFRDKIIKLEKWSEFVIEISVLDKAESP